jgi:hypothetical protein
MSTSFTKIRKSKRLFVDGGRIYKELRAVKASRRKQIKRKIESR